MRHSLTAAPPRDSGKGSGSDTGSGGRAALPRRSLLLWGGSALALAACNRVDYRAPFASVTGGFEKGAPARSSEAATRDWWLAFRDKELDTLVQSGLQRNLDVRQAIEAINEARASAAGAAANDLPQASGSASAARGDAQGTGTVTDTTALGGSVSWIADLFGANANTRAGAAARLDAAYAQADVARLVMQTGIAMAYIDLRYYQASMALTRRSLESRRQSLSLTKSQFDAGAADRLDVLQAEQLVAEGEAQLPGYETGFDQSLARLATLTAQRSGDLRPRLQRGASQPRPRFKASVGVPAQVVAARPDVRLAERSYAAAAYDVGVAEAQFYPSISLSGNIAATNIRTGSNIKAWTLGPAINLPIFTGGANTANLRGAESRAVQAKLAWEGAVLNAIEEVESGLAAYRRDGRNVAAQQRLVDTSTEAVGLARTNFSIGDGAFLNILDSERSQLSAQQGLASALRQQAANFVTLSAAAAGGTATGA